MNNTEYEIIRPQEPIRIARVGRVNYHIDATGFCFAQHLADFDRDIVSSKDKVPCIKGEYLRE